MLDMELINETISELENTVTTFDTCAKLSSLYIIKEYYRPASNDVVNVPQDEVVRRELSDILPHYNMYVKLKTEYQTGQLDKEPVLQALRSVVNEIKEFTTMLYNSTDMPEERELLEEIKI